MLIKLVLFIFIFIFTSCNTKNDIHISSIQDDTFVLLNNINIDIDGIQKQIEKSLMNDFGYRQANAQLDYLLSPYATYYLSQAKIHSGLMTKINEQAMANAFLEIFENTSDLSLIDIYCTFALIGDYHTLISDKAKENINVFFDFLYCDEIGAYDSFVSENDIKPIYWYVYSTYLVKKVSMLIDIEIKPIHEWLQKVIEEVLNTNFIDSHLAINYSNSFPALLHLIRFMDLEVPTDLFIDTINIFEKNLLNITRVQESTFLPLYFLDYFELCLLMNHDTSIYHEYIITSLTNENGLNTNLFVFTEDVLSLHAIVLSLSYSGYNFINDLILHEVFNFFNKFMLDDVLYIQPFSSTSNIMDTYYVTSIKNMLNFNKNEYLNLYCESILGQMINSDVVTLKYYLGTLYENNQLYIINDVKDEISINLLNILDYWFNTDVVTDMKIKYIIASIEALNIIDTNFSIKIDRVNELMNNFEVSDNPDITLILDTMRKIQIIQFKKLINHQDEEDIFRLFEQISDNLINISNLKIDGILNIYYMAINIFEEYEYAISDNLAQALLVILYNSIHPSGLFKGGDTIYDLASFQSTYKALSMLEMISRQVNEGSN